MTINEHGLPAERLARLNPLQLAYIGDTIYDLYVRSRMLMTSDANVRVLHMRASKLVCAKAQSDALERIAGRLTDAEKDIVRRGRNAKARSMPKHADPADYGRATALEALVGYLYLAGHSGRLDEIMRIALEGNEERECPE